MSRRIYWLLPDRDSAWSTMDDLLLAGIEARHIHFVAREGTDMTGLNPANVLQTSGRRAVGRDGPADRRRRGRPARRPGRGALPHRRLRTQLGHRGALAVAGAVFGTWTSSMIGVSTPSKRLARFEKQIEEGQILMMVDVPLWQVEKIEARLRHTAPRGAAGGDGAGYSGFPLSGHVIAGCGASPT
jgi:hypothetical protein